MAGAVLLVFFIAASFVVVRIGAAALELTGMPWEQAKFQALSAFTNAGFTTAESEKITEHPVRRSIVAYLIVLGNAGLVTTIGSFAGSIMGSDPLDFGINMLGMVVGVAIVLWIARKPKLAQRMRDSFQRRLVARYGALTVSPEQLLRLENGLSLTKIHLDEKSPVVGRALADLGLKHHKIQVLSIERGKTFIPVPSGDDILQAGDFLVLYGAGTVANGLFKPDRAQTLTVVPGAKKTDGPQPPR